MRGSDLNVHGFMRFVTVGRTDIIEQMMDPACGPKTRALTRSEKTRAQKNIDRYCRVQFYARHIDFLEGKKKSDDQLCQPMSGQCAYLEGEAERARTPAFA